MCESGSAYSSAKGTSRKVSTLDFVELAGSEVLYEAAVLRRNRSLETLGKVVRALGQKNAHIPYRLAG